MTQLRGDGRWWRIGSLAVGMILAGATAATAQTGPAAYARVVLGGDTVLAEMAVSPEERAQGLMHRNDVPDGTGMLFVFPDVRVRSFWMVNTYVPLDIAYMDSAFRIVDIQQLEPQDGTSRPSKGPAMYALEVRQGWFAEHGVQVGDVAAVEFGVAPPR